MSPRTAYLGRLLGLFMLIMGTGECTQGTLMVAMADQMVHDPALLLMSGLATATAGLAIVLAHNVWRGSAVAVIVTVLGWLLLIKGAALVIVPASGWTTAVLASHYADYYLAWAAIPLILGGYLTFAGFSARLVKPL